MVSALPAASPYLKQAENSIPKPSLASSRGRGQMRATAPPPTGARASLEIDANPMSFQKKLERG